MTAIMSLPDIPLDEDNVGADEENDAEQKQDDPLVQRLGNRLAH